MHITRLLMIFAALAALASCHDTATETPNPLMRYASGDAMLLASGDASAVLRLCSDVQPRGIDVATSLAVVNAEGERLVAATLTDRQAAIAWLDSLCAARPGFSRQPDEGGAPVYATGRLWRVVVDDSAVVAVMSPQAPAGPQAVIDRFVAHAASAPLLPWQADALADTASEATAIVNIAILADAYRQRTSRQLMPDQIEGYDVGAISQGYAVARLTSATAEGHATHTAAIDFVDADGHAIPSTAPAQSATLADSQLGIVPGLGAVSYTTNPLTITVTEK